LQSTGPQLTAQCETNEGIRLSTYSSASPFSADDSSTLTLQTATLNDSLKHILEMTSTVHDLFFTLSQTASSSPPPPNSKYIQGRSRRRQRRQLAQSTRRRAESSDSENSDEEDVRNRTLGGEISFAQLSLRERVKRVQDDLGSAVIVLREGVEELAGGEEGDEGAAEIWAMLAFALEDWR
jgi:hypothetical protein